ncbi:MAG: protoporphyrinogen oxidase [Sandaracinus sp.]
MTAEMVVVGAGVSGLAAAWALGRAGARVTVLERGTRIGGLVESERVGDVLLEHGADGLLSSKRGGHDVLSALGLGSALTRHGRAPRRALLLRGDRLDPMPAGLFAFERRAVLTMLASSILSARAKARLSMEPFVRAAGGEDEAVASFFARRFGDEVAEHLSGPMMRGVYGADARVLGMHAVLPTLAEYEAKYGSVSLALAVAPRKTKGGALVAVEGGMSRIARRLARASGASISLESGVRRIDREKRGVAVTLESGRALHADGVVIATEARTASRLVDGLSPELAALLGEIDGTSVDVVTLGYPRTDVAHPLDATGYVVGGEGGRTLACTFASEKWQGRAPDGVAVFRSVLRAGAAGESDDEIARVAASELAPVIGARGEPSLVRVRRRPSALPVYAVGHRARTARVRALAGALGPVALAGNYLGGVGVPDCIASGLDAAENVLRAAAG